MGLFIIFIIAAFAGIYLYVSVRANVTRKNKNNPLDNEDTTRRID